MPNNKQAVKRMRKNEDQRMHNKTVRTSMRTAVKKVLKAETAEEAEKALPEAMKRIDKAAKDHIIHDNAAARTKSRLARNIRAK